MSVQQVIQRTRALDEGARHDLKRPVLSSNMVTGLAFNVPIALTCQPSKVCARNCYAAQIHKPIAMPVALAKQIEVFHALKDNPHAVAAKIVRELTSKLRKPDTAPKFLRWNGVGDLFEESVTCLVEVARALPHFPIWVVTRIPKYAAQVPDLPNVFVHFSLDASSLERYGKVLALSPKSSRMFFSYTADKDEPAPPPALSEIPISVYFSDSYSAPPPQGYAEVSCPLNTRSDLVDACAACRRCWSEDALALKDSPAARGLGTLTPPTPTPEPQGSLF